MSQLEDEIGESAKGRLEVNSRRKNLIGESEGDGGMIGLCSGWQAIRYIRSSSPHCKSKENGSLVMSSEGLRFIDRMIELNNGRLGSKVTSEVGGFGVELVRGRMGYAKS